jgi:hypothetical protein
MDGKPTKVSCFTINLNLNPTGLLSIWAGNKPDEVADAPKYQVNPNSADTVVYEQVLSRLATAMQTNADHIFVSVQDGKWIVRDGGGGKAIAASAAVQPRPAPSMAKPAAARGKPTKAKRSKKTTRKAPKKRP